MSTATQPRTYLPADHDDLDAMTRALTRSDATSLALVGPGGRVAVPKEVHDILVQVVGAMREGKAITVTPSERVLTTQQAADLLGVSRPTLVKLIDDGEIPCERVSQRRKVNISDVIAYRERRREAQYAAIAATSVDLDDEEDLETVLADLRAARHAVAAPRRARQTMS